MKKFGMSLLKTVLIYGGAIGGAMLGKIAIDKIVGKEVEQVEGTEFENENEEEIIDVETEA